MKNKITQKQLKERLNYDENTGIFVWKTNRRSTSIGSTAGCLNKILGYLVIRIDGSDYYGHRLAWLYMNGEFPIDGVDHIDGDRSNNIFTNLRQATQLQNQKNQKIHKDNTSGFKGVSWSQKRQKWVAQICLNYKQMYLGAFNCAKEASIVRNNAAKDLHKEFAKF